MMFRKQFLFKSWIMLKMFLAASSTSACSFIVLSLIAPEKFAKARVAYMAIGSGKSLVGVGFGAAILGAGILFSRVLQTC